VIAIALACASILCVIILLPLSWPTLTHIEKISRLALISLNRLPEVFCKNEIKACGELNLFLNMTKQGEESTHKMIKKHKHRKD
jgi:superfamily I DNA and/or RNA helicase